MNLHEYQAKALLAEYGVPVSPGRPAFSVSEALEAANALGGDSWMVKAQIHGGGRGKAGGVKKVSGRDALKNAAESLLGKKLVTHQTGPTGQPVQRLLIEQTSVVKRELYLACLLDRALERIVFIASSAGGMDIEEIAAKKPGSLMRVPVDIRKGVDIAAVKAAVPANTPFTPDAVASVLERLYRIYREFDAELIEINPLVLTRTARMLALDCKLVVDDSALSRQPDMARVGSPEKLTELETRAAALGLKYIELDGDVGVLANGAGLTMTTMDAISHFGGKPANFMEIGGESYTKAKPALEIVLANPRVKALLVNFCGAFARTDVMAEGVVNAWKQLAPKIPIVFTIHGTNEDEAIAIVKAGLGITPHDLMDDAVKAAVAAAKT